MKYSKVIEQHEKRLAEMAGQNNPFMNEVKRMMRGVSSLENLAVNRNPRHTEELHISEIAKSARRLQKEADAASDRVNAIYRNKFLELEQKINDRAGLYANPETAKEIRQALRAMPEKDRIKAINDAVQRGDGEAIKSISGASELLTGISSDVSARSVQAIQQQKAGDLVQELKLLDEGFSMSLAVLKDVNSAVREGFDPGKLREIEEKERIHQEAVSNFEGAFGDHIE